jgi:hypothetical protein
MKRAGVVLAALLVVLAGCTGGPAGAPTTTLDDGGTDAPAGANDGNTDSSDDGESSGSVNFYVSDRPGAMDDFASLNVTIDEVRFHLVDAANGSDDGNATSENGTVTNESATTTVTANATATNATATQTVTPEVEEEAEDEADDAEADADEADEEADDEEAEDGDGRWVVRDGNGTTVDLTRLLGDNATLVAEFDVPAGEYDRVVLEVSDVNATLTDGSDQRVKLPSGKLQLNTEFEVGTEGEVDFVYDIMVHKAGNSGKYILRPVVSESGTDQPIDPVDKQGRPVDDERDDDEGEDESERLTVALQGELAAGENVTVQVTNGSDAVANATVMVNGETVGTTDADGELVVTVPADAEELEVEVTAGDSEGELEREFGDGADDESGDDESENAGDGEERGNGSDR